MIDFILFLWNIGYYIIYSLDSENPCYIHGTGMYARQIAHCYGDYAIGICINFRKAFDTVDHSILLYKLYHNGVRGPAYDWFCDYLYNRTQFVSMIFILKRYLYLVVYLRVPY